MLVVFSLLLCENRLRARTQITHINEEGIWIMTCANTKWDFETDLVVGGSGIGGLTAALTACSLGLKVVVLEKDSALGGVTAYSTGEVWVGNNYLEKAEGVEDSEEETLAYLKAITKGTGDEEVLTTFVKNAPKALELLAQMDVPWKIIKNFADYYYRKAPGAKGHGRYLEMSPFPGNSLGKWAAKVRNSPHVPSGITHDEMLAWGGAASIKTWDFELVGQRVQEDYRTFGPGIAAALVKAALDRKIPLYTQAPILELIFDGTKVLGIRTERDGKDCFIRARKGVVLAVGGYDWHKEFVRYYEDLPQWESCVPPAVEGDGLILAGEVGAAVASVPPAGYVTLVGFHIPGEEHEEKPLYRITLEVGLPHSIVVNKKGQRFGDESWTKGMFAAVRQFDSQTQTWPNIPFYLIVDQEYRDRYGIGSVSPGQPLPEGLGVTADTIQELATKLDIDPNGLVDTVQRFNEFAKVGKDDDFRRGSIPFSNSLMGDLNVKPNPNLGTISRPPFTGIPLFIVNAGMNAAGLKTNSFAQVMSVRNKPIPGLYACGNTAAYLELGHGYQSGLPNARGMTFGYLAAQHAASIIEED